MKKSKYNVKIGEKHGRFTVIGETYHDKKSGFRLVKCECECKGKDSIKDIRVCDLVTGHNRSCGCLHIKNKVNIGDKYNKLTVIGEPYKKYIIYRGKNWPKLVVPCKCDCGNECESPHNALIRNRKKSCGCSKNANKYNVNIGDKYHHLTIISEPYTKEGNMGRFIMVKCDCGKEVETRLDRLLRGQKSCYKYCKCYIYAKKPETKKQHHMSHRRIWRIWYSMRNRCYCPTTTAYKWYGGKGIIICDRWKDHFLVFKEWAYNHGYNDTLTIERKDPEGNYCPENCEWITRSENSKRRNDYYKNKIVRLEARVKELENNILK